MTAKRTIPIALESGKSRTFASALEWPGWSRSGKGDEAALQALLDYAERYERAVRRSDVDFKPPEDIAAFDVVEHLRGDATTDFGAPNMAPAFDAEPMDAREVARQAAILAACWDALTDALRKAEGKTLRTGPRGGGRQAGKVAEHVTGAHASYLRRIYWRDKPPKSATQTELIAFLKAADKPALEFATSDEMPETGPRGGSLWKPRYFVRRAAWHILDHAWEIEDRIE